MSAPASDLKDFLDENFDDEFVDLGESKCLTPDDLVRIATVAEPTPSPDGKVVAFVKTRTVERDDKLVRLRSIYVVDAAPPHAQRQLTSGEGDSSPTWSPGEPPFCFKTTFLFAPKHSLTIAIELSRTPITRNHGTRFALLLRPLARTNARFKVCGVSS